MYRFLLSVLLLAFLPFSAVADEKTQPMPQKIHMIIITQPGCHPCERIEEYLGYKKFKELTDKHFTITKLDISEIDKLPKGLEEPYGTPTIYFLNSSDKQIAEPMIGGKSEENFMDLLREVIAANR